MDRNEVEIAFEIVMEEIEAVANALNQEGAAAFQKGDYERARQVIEDATRIAGFRAKVKALQQEWQTGFPSARRKKAKRTGMGRLGRGLRTPEDAFRIPILEALVELGGSAEIGKVLDRVGRKVRSLLNEHDMKALPSDPKSIRWRNTAQWCRMTMVNEGLLKGDSPHGVWEITAAGKKTLEAGAS